MTETTATSLPRRLRFWDLRQATTCAPLRLLAGLEWLLGVFVGCTLLYSGLQHLGNLFYFLASVYQYQIVPTWLGPLVGMGLPCVQIVIGCCLIGRAGVDAGLLAACGLLALFVVAQCLALGRGLEIPCGCFGTSKYEPVDAWTIARTVGLLGIAVLALAVRRTANSR